MLDLRHLREALVAAEHRSFRRAASILGVSQFTLSRRIRLLEQRLGFSLFERNFSGVTQLASLLAAAGIVVSSRRDGNP
jgi:DNA-binding transcriptional LysR family regulator